MSNPSGVQDPNGSFIYKSTNSFDPNAEEYPTEIIYRSHNGEENVVII